MADHVNNFQRVMQSLLDGAGTTISSKTVVGEPVIVGDTTIIPLSDVTIGCAAGANNADRKDSGSGGFAAKLSPSAVLIIRGGTVKVVNIKNQDAVTKLVDMVPDIVDRFTSRKPDMMDGEEAVEYAFPHRKKEEKKQAEQDSERP
ncbi:MAG: GerW family sporulation protein [Lachnospiraceae bacterium]|nr:GerW family sporulation protein [Lachnospiraceae bacterium]MDY6287068.1 GerW family sporulation protein [Lachnospiraceae bacterium]MDY6334768.1 GerW family sporulation protein [Lachnospiraceae bacterium]MDY6341349.1 GerW family sporulation protein [Lachnospiraceae bacterium]